MKQINHSFSNQNNKEEYSTLRKILLSITIISLSLTVLISSSKALFIGEEEVKTHVVTGNLDFEFNRTKLIGEALNNRGFLEKFNDESKVNLKESGANAFNIKEMVPGALYQGTFNLVNIGSTAFNAKISFTNLENSNEYILNQIKISLDLFIYRNSLIIFIKQLFC